jgi:hypothetical protein
MLNFGAFLAFMGVNLATLWQFTFRPQPGYRRNPLLDTVLPLVGFIFCAAIWWTLNPLAKIVGGIWLAIGFCYLAVITRGFRSEPVAIDFSASLGEPRTTDAKENASLEKI